MSVDVQHDACGLVGRGSSLEQFVSGMMEVSGSCIGNGIDARPSLGR